MRTTLGPPAPSAASSSDGERPRAAAGHQGAVTASEISLERASRLGHRFEALPPPSPSESAPIQKSDDEEKAKKLLERLKRSNQRAKTKKRKQRSEKFAALNQTGLNFQNGLTPTLRVDTGFGTSTVSTGRGEGPRISTRKTDFSDKPVADTYKDVISKLVPAGTDESKVARELLARMSDANAPLQEIVDQRQLNAATKFTGITQISEERRNPGSAKLARAGLRLVEKKQKTLQDVFTGPTALFPPARPGGTGQMRDMLSGDQDPEGGELEAELSESSGEESG